MSIFCQTPKQYNLCGTTKFLAWNGNLTPDQHTTEILTSIDHEINIFLNLEGAVIVAPGYFRHENLGKESCIKSLNKIKYPKDSKIRLVLCNLHPTLKFAIGKSLPDLYAIYKGCTNDTRSHIGIGLNLAHYYINNLYDIKNEDGIKSLLNEYEQLFDIKLSFIIFEDYCSDSQESCCIGTGNIQYTPEAIKFICSYCYTNNIPLITHCRKDIDFLLHLASITHL